MFTAFETEIVLVLVLAMLVALIAKKMKLQYTIVLVLAGLAVSFFDLGITPLSREIIFFLFLPPLLFEGAVHLHLADLKENKSAIVLLSVLGILISVAVIGVGLWLLLGIPLLYCLLFGAIISPTDPISVLAIFKKLGVPKKLATIVEGESLFNDGTGVVIFEIILGLVLLHHVTIAAGILEFIKVVIGGMLIGAITGGLIFMFMKNIDDHLIEVVATIILAYGAFLLSELFHVSGVIAVVTAGLFIGNYGTKFAMSPRTRVAIVNFWELMVFVVNSLIFIMLGATIPIQGFFTHITLILAGILVVLVARALSVYPLASMLGMLKEKIPWNWRHVLHWGGLRGSIPIALVLGIQLLDIPFKEEITYMTFGVVLFSLVVQGLTMPALLKRLNITTEDKTSQEAQAILARKAAIKSALRTLNSAHEDGEIGTDIYIKLKKEYDHRLRNLKKQFVTYMRKHALTRNSQEKIARQKSLLAEKSAINLQLEHGYISEEAGTPLLEEIDKQLDQF
ncbi:MAG: Na+/H+ antiporter [archaeon]